MRPRREARTAVEGEGTTEAKPAPTAAEATVAAFAVSCADSTSGSFTGSGGGFAVVLMNEVVVGISDVVDVIAVVVEDEPVVRGEEVDVVVLVFV